MPNAVSNLTIALIDKISGPAKQVQASLKQLASADKSLAGGTKGAAAMAASLDKVTAAGTKAAKSASGFQASWSKGFSDGIGKLNLTAAQLEKVRASYEKLQSQLKSQGLRRPEQFLPKLDAWERDQLRSLRNVTAAHEKAASRIRRAHEHAAPSRLAGAARFGVAAVGVGSGAYAANRGVRGVVRSGANEGREEARDYQAGLTPDETARLRVRTLSLSGQYPSLDATTLHERLRDTAMAMRSLDKAMELSETIAQGQVALQSLKGKDQALEEGRKFFKALDNLGKNVDPKEVRELFHGMIKAQGVEGADLNLANIMIAARRAKSAGAAMSNRFWMTVAPGLMEDMGPDRFGTAMGSTLSQVIGGRATKASKAAQRSLGLRDKRGRFVGGDLLLSDPDMYTAKHLIPALQKQKVDIDSPVAVSSALSKLFSNQLVADVFSKLVIQREQYAGKAAQYAKAPGLDAASKLPGKDPYVALEGFMSQLRNLGVSLSEGPLKQAVPLLNDFSAAIGNLAARLQQTKWLDKPENAAAVAGAGLFGGWKLLQGARSAWHWWQGTGSHAGAPGSTAPAGGSMPETTARGVMGRVMGNAMRFGGPAGILLGSTSPANQSETDYSKLEPWKRRWHYNFPSGDFTHGPSGLKPWARTPTGQFSRMHPAYASQAGNTPLGRAGNASSLSTVLFDPAGSLREGGAANVSIVRARPTDAPADAPIGKPKIDTQPAVDELAAKAKQAADLWREGLDVSARPRVDSSSLDDAIDKAKELELIINRLGGMTARPRFEPQMSPVPGQASPGKQSSVGQTIRALHADYGIKDIG